MIAVFADYCIKKELPEEQGRISFDTLKGFAALSPRILLAMCAAVYNYSYVEAVMNCQI